MILEACVQIQLATIGVTDQDRALRFYTTVLGFEKKDDVAMGQLRWLTVSSPEGLEGTELVLELTDFPPSQTYQKARFDAGIPATAFITRNVEAEYSRLKSRGVQFRGEPQEMGPIKAVVFDDTCGNLINLVERRGQS
jgi:catechol 2,3-dioxygenase-like lactoylglutathione lyase family enzyme